VREAELSVKDVEVTYGSGRAAVCAIDRVSLAFQAGRLTLVMGPSGSGKTTLLSVLGCLLMPDGGAAYVMGQLVTALSEEERGELRRQCIGYVFQAFRLFRSLSALENVLLALDIAGGRGRRAKEEARRALHTVGLGDKWRLKPDELSGGEKQRVAIARALVNDPRIILADEPTASLDSHAGEQVAGMLLRLAEEEKRLVVVVSHDPRWRSFSHRTVVMRDGRIVEDQEV
jgi:putative ABC transport system ATP-binding protein